MSDILESSPAAAAPLSPKLADVRQRRRIPSCMSALVLALCAVLLAFPVAADDYQYGYNDQYNNGLNDAADDDFVFEWDENLSFSDVAVMPVSCINYNGGHMIKFEFFKSENNFQCHLNQIGYFVVSIAHYMRAYFNYQAIQNGQYFSLPGDAGYLNCVMLQETAYADTKLYAKIGCMDRQTFTSTKLQLHVYTDDQCSIKYDDGNTEKRHSTKGYEINGYSFSTRVSFRPPFYACLDCEPPEISETFNKMNSNWYDDDYISQAAANGDDEAEADDAGDDAAGDDAYMAANDDVNYNNDDAANDDAVNDDAVNDDAANDDAANDDAANDDAANDDGNRYNFDDDYYKDDDGRRLLSPTTYKLQAAPGQLEKYHQDFWNEINDIRRNLDYYDIGDWNMCQQMYKYGVWCNKECQALDSFRLDEWSKSDIFLLVMMCCFMAAMMALVVAKRLKAKEKGRLYDDADVKPGLSPLSMSVIFCIILVVIIVMAKLKFVNETLLFAVVTCILLFIYMLKLTLFQRRRPVLLAAPKHEDMVFDNPLDDRLFD